MNQPKLGSGGEEYIVFRYKVHSVIFILILGINT
jgi:hypothetical protein